MLFRTTERGELLDVTTRSSPVVAGVVMALIVPTSWLLLLFSNQDPYYLGICLALTLLFAPASAIVLRRALDRTRQRRLRFLYVLVAMNALLVLAVMALLLFGALRPMGGSG